MWLKTAVIGVALSGCASQRDSVCGYPGMKLSDQMASRHCEQVLMRRGDYSVSSGNPYVAGRTVVIREERNQVPTGRVFIAR